MSSVTSVSPSFINNPIIQSKVSAINTDIKASSVVKRVFSSYLFWYAAGSVSLLASILKANVEHPAILLAVSGVALAIIVAKWKQTRYEASIIPTVLFNKWNPQKYPWCNSIIDGKLYLGAIPLKNLGHLEELQKLGITAVLTVLEAYEYCSSSLFSEPVVPEDYQRLGITSKQIPSEDFHAMPQNHIDEGVEFLHEEIDIKNGVVYDHCKAGRGRSTTVIICYLMKYGHLHGIVPQGTTTEERVRWTINFVKAQRDVINLNRYQRAAIVQWCEAKGL